MSRLVAGVALGALLVGCGVLDGDEGDVMVAWDLRDTRAIEAVGWPEDAGSSFEATTGQGLERILLPGDVVVEGEFRVNPTRDGGLGGRPHDDQLRDVSVTFERESVEAVVDRARGYADALGVELGDIPAWAAANADGQDLSPGGTTARSEEAVLPDGSIAYLRTRAFVHGDAVLRLIVFWPVEDG